MQLPRKAVSAFLSAAVHLIKKPATLKVAGFLAFCSLPHRTVQRSCDNDMRNIRDLKREKQI